MRLEARVDLQVLLEVGCSGKGFWAVLAAIWAVGSEQSLLSGVVIHRLGDRALARALVTVAVQQVLQFHITGGRGAPGVAVRIFAHVGVVVVWL